MKLVYDRTIDHDSEEVKNAPLPLSEIIHNNFEMVDECLTGVSMEAEKDLGLKLLEKIGDVAHAPLARFLEVSIIFMRRKNDNEKTKVTVCTHP